MAVAEFRRITTACGTTAALGSVTTPVRAAFSSMPKGDPPRTVLAVLKGNLFFNVLVGGATATGLPAAKQIAQLILSRV